MPSALRKLLYLRTTFKGQECGLLNSENENTMHVSVFVVSVTGNQWLILGPFSSSALHTIDMLTRSSLNKDLLKY